MWPELAATYTCADETFRITFCSSRGIIRSTTDRIAPTGCTALKEGSCGLFERASTSSPPCLDACWARRRFHTCGTCPCASSRLPANYAWPNYPSSGNSGNLLPEHSLVRIADLERVFT